MISTFRWCASALVALLVLSAPAIAQTASESSEPGSAPALEPATAKELVTRATRLFQAGEYDKAIADYQSAYQLKPLPTLLFNIAQANRKAERYQDALTYYERFLKEDPHSVLVPEAEAQLSFVRAKLDAARLSSEREALERLARQRAAEAEALAKAREEERKKAQEALLLATAKQDKPIYKKPWFWVIIGGVVVGGVVGIALGVALQPKEPQSDLGVRVVQF